MREVRKFGKRTRVFKEDQPGRIKYYLVFEGESTEYVYFKALDNLRNQIKINPLIELVPLFRSHSEAGWSNPKKILNRVIENIEENITGEISYETLLNRIIHGIEEEQFFYDSDYTSKEVYDMLKDCCYDKLEKHLSDIVDNIDRVAEFLIIYLEEKIPGRDIFTNINKKIKEPEFTYVRGFDKLCLIVDRDRKSFKADEENNQYEYVIEKCKKNGFDFYITNPCFEFWLLLHFDHVFNIDKEKMTKNERVSQKLKYAEAELKKVLPGFSKSKYNAANLIKKIDDAIANSKKFSEDIIKLEYSIGSNIGLLITQMRSSDRISYKD